MTNRLVAVNVQEPQEHSLWSQETVGVPSSQDLQYSDADFDDEDIAFVPSHSSLGSRMNNESDDEESCRPRGAQAEQPGPVTPPWARGAKRRR